MDGLTARSLVREATARTGLPGLSALVQVHGTSDGEEIGLAAGLADAVTAARDQRAEAQAAARRATAKREEDEWGPTHAQSVIDLILKGASSEEVNAEIRRLRKQQAETKYRIVGPPGTYDDEVSPGQAHVSAGHIQGLATADHDTMWDDLPDLETGELPVGMDEVPAPPAAQAVSPPGGVTPQAR